MNNKQNNIEKQAEDLNRHFSKEDMQMAKKHVKRYSTLLLVREMQIKMIIRYLFILVRIEKYTNNKCWKGCGKKRNYPTLLMGMEISTGTMENTMEVPQKSENKTAI